MKIRHAIALVVGILSAVPCHATWIVVGENSNTLLILDNDTISYAAEDDKDNRVAVLVNVLKAPAKEFSNVTDASGKSVKQVIRSMQFDCKAKKSRIITGELLDEDLNTLGEISSSTLETPAADSLTQKELSMVCSADLKHQATVVKQKHKSSFVLRV
jgi:hypothetical protein